MNTSTAKVEPVQAVLQRDTNVQRTAETAVNFQEKINGSVRDPLNLFTTKNVFVKQRKQAETSACKLCFENKEPKLTSASTARQQTSAAMKKKTIVFLCDSREDSKYFVHFYTVMSFALIPIICGISVIHFFKNECHLRKFLKTLRVTIQRKATEHYFPVVLFIML